MEFKGTKVFPKYDGGDNYSIDLIFENESVISIDRRSRYNDKVVCSREEMEANALLISKAPELLHLLIEICNNIENENIIIKQNTDDDYYFYNEAKKLIKESTEL